MRYYPYVGIKMPYSHVQMTIIKCCSFRDLCLVQGTAACKYASKLLKTVCAAQPKGCARCKGPLDHLLIVRYACFVPVMAIKKPVFLAGGRFH